MVVVAAWKWVMAVSFLVTSCFVVLLVLRHCESILVWNSHSFRFSHPPAGIIGMNHYASSYFNWPNSMCQKFQKISSSSFGFHLRTHLVSLAVYNGSGTCPHPPFRVTHSQAYPLDVLISLSVKPVPHLCSFYAQRNSRPYPMLQESMLLRGLLP